MTIAMSDTENTSGIVTRKCNIPMLIDDLEEAKRVVREIEHKILVCNHQFKINPPFVTSRVIDHGESMGTSKVFVMEQTRACTVCGITQVKFQYNPDDLWTEWKSP